MLDMSNMLTINKACAANSGFYSHRTMNGKIGIEKLCSFQRLSFLIDCQKEYIDNRQIVSSLQPYPVII